MIKKFLHSKSKTITFSAILVGGSIFLSRILGFLRDNLLANLFSKFQTDIYFAAFRIPDFLYGILITGGITAAFMPVFAESLNKGKDYAKKMINNVLTFFLLMLIVLSLILFIFTPQLLDVVTPGFNSVKRARTVVLTRIMFLSPILLGLSAIVSSVLKYYHLFFAYALAPIFYNLGIIAGILFLAPFFGLKGLAMGVILGTFLHLAIQIPSLVKEGYLPKLSFNFKFPELKRVLYLMVPRVVSSATYHINLIVVTAIASGLLSGSITVFNFANNLRYVPVGIVGMSFAMASFPSLSRNFAGKKKKKFLGNFYRTLYKILFLIVPSSVLVFLLRAQIVRVVLGTSLTGEGSFGWGQTQLTAACLGIFSISLFAATLVPFLSRVFFSSHDTKTPVKISVFSMALNISLCFLFVHFLRFSNFFSDFLRNFLNLKGVEGFAVIGLPLALSISVVLQALFLFYYLYKKFEIDLKKVGNFLGKVILSSLVMGALMYGALHFYVLFLDGTVTALGILAQGVFAGLVGVGAYLLVSRILGINYTDLIISSFVLKFKEKIKKYGKRKN